MNKSDRSKSLIKLLRSVLWSTVVSNVLCEWLKGWCFTENQTRKIFSWKKIFHEYKHLWFWEQTLSRKAKHSYRDQATSQAEWKSFCHAAYTVRNFHQTRLRVKAPFICSSRSLFVCSAFAIDSESVMCSLLCQCWYSTYWYFRIVIIFLSSLFSLIHSLVSKCKVINCIYISCTKNNSLN